MSRRAVLALAPVFAFGCTSPVGGGSSTAGAGSGGASTDASATVGPGDDAPADAGSGTASGEAGSGSADTSGSTGGTASDTNAGAITMTLWTFNILNPSNPLSPGADVDVRTQMVIDRILDEQPDLIAMQEVVQSDEISNRAEFIATETGYDWVWHEEYSLGTYDEGIAVLSRTPIVDSATVELPHTDLVLFTRYVLGTRIETEVGEVDFYSTHMTVGGGEAQSADQALAAWEFVNERSAGLPSFFAGDLNAEPDTPSMQFLRGDAEHSGSTGDFTDLWRATQGDADGFTIESDDPHDRIDYIYATSTGTAAITPGDCRLIFDEPIDDIYASDHIGVSCDVSVAP